MESFYRHPLVIFGNRLFYLRRWLYGIPLLILLTNAPGLYFPKGSHAYEEVVEVTALLIALAGVLLRFWTSGSVARSVLRKKKQIQFRFHDKGIYSIVRQPYFAADFLIILGLSLPLIHPALILLSVCLFLLLYTPVLFAREMILSHLHPVSYVRYCEQVHLVLPSFRHYKPAKTRFRWQAAMGKEGNLLAVIGMLLYGIEQFRDFQIQGSFDYNLMWTLFVLPFFFLYLALRTFDKHLEEFPANPDILD